MSQDGHSSETPLEESTDGYLDDNGGGTDAAPGPPENPMMSSPPNDNSPGTELRRRTEALERILMGSDSNLSTTEATGNQYFSDLQTKSESCRLVFLSGNSVSSFFPFT